MILKNRIITYADTTTLHAEVASPSERTKVANSLNNSLPIEAVLAVKQDLFIVLAEKFLCDQ